MEERIRLEVKLSTTGGVICCIGKKGAFISSKSHLCVQLPVEKKDAMWKCLSIWCQTNAGCVAFALGGGSELSVLTIKKVGV